MCFGANVPQDSSLPCLSTSYSLQWKTLRAGVGGTSKKGGFISAPERGLQTDTLIPAPPNPSTMSTRTASGANRKFSLQYVLSELPSSTSNTHRSSTKIT